MTAPWSWRFRLFHVCSDPHCECHSETRLKCATAEEEREERRVIRKLAMKIARATHSYQFKDAADIIEPILSDWFDERSRR